MNTSPLDKLFLDKDGYPACCECCLDCHDCSLSGIDWHTHDGEDECPVHPHATRVG